MHLLISALNVVAIAVFLAIVFTAATAFLGRRVGYAAIALVIVAGVTALHYLLNHSWTLVGKIAADLIVPSLMGWAGFYLATKEVENVAEKRLWQWLFGGLALFGITIGVLVELQLDEDHTNEINGLKENINELQTHVRVDMMTTITDYNNAHPQHPVSVEQVADLLRLCGRIVPAVSQQALPQNTQTAARKLVAPQALVPYHTPVIQSAPKMFSSTGEIVGTNIGPGGGRSLRIRVRMRDIPDTGPYAQGGRAGPDRLLGDSDPNNYVYVDSKCIQQWTPENIQLKFDSNFWPQIIYRVQGRADNIHATAPQPDDLEVGYQIYGPDGDSSNWLYVK